MYSCRKKVSDQGHGIAVNPSTITGNAYALAANMTAERWPLPIQGFEQNEELAGAVKIHEVQSIGSAACPTCSIHSGTSEGILSAVACLIPVLFFHCDENLWTIPFAPFSLQWLSL